MEFLEGNQICEWAVEHGLQRGTGVTLDLPDLAPHPSEPFADGGLSGREGTAARDLLASLASWDQCLVWITLWGVWPSGEDWPRFYAWRGAQGERRSLRVAPGHLFNTGEVALLAELLELIMQNAWDADIFCSRQGRADGRRATISHDEWYQLFG